MEKITKICKGCGKQFEIQITHPLCLRREYCSNVCKSIKFRKENPRYYANMRKKQRENRVIPVRFCKYPSCNAVLSQCNKDENYCLMHQRKMLQEDAVVEEEKKLLKSKKWKQLTYWKDCPAFFKNILAEMPRGYSCLAKKKVCKGSKKRVYAVFVRTLGRKDKYISQLKRVYLSNLLGTALR